MVAFTPQSMLYARKAHQGNVRVIYFINPRRMRESYGSLCVCVCVCLSVCLSVTALAASYLIYTLKTRRR